MRNKSGTRAHFLEKFFIIFRAKFCFYDLVLFSSGAFTLNSAFLVRILYFDVVKIQKDQNRTFLDIFEQFLAKI